MRRWTTVILVGVVCSAPACSPKPEAPAGTSAGMAGVQAAPPRPITAKPAAAATAEKPAKATTGAANAGQAAAAAEAAQYSQRRIRKRPVIGGCEESCETPERMMAAFFDALALPKGAQRRDALAVLFDWSQLRVDGDRRGERWAEQWADPAGQALRQRDIDAWLDDLGAVREQLVGDKALMQWRARGVTFTAVANRPELFDVHLRAAPVAGAAQGAMWRFVAVRRGWEWLITVVDHKASEGPAAYAGIEGSAQRGRL